LRAGRAKKRSSKHAIVSISGKKFKINKVRFGIAIGVIICAGIFTGAHIYAANTNTFPENAILNGVNVGGMNAPEAERAIQSAICSTKTVKAGEHTLTFKPAYQTDLQEELVQEIKEAALSPFERNRLKKGKIISVKFKSGVRETEEKIKEADHNGKGYSRPHDAKIMYSSSEGLYTVKEKEGNFLNYSALERQFQKDISKNLRQRTFSYTKKSVYLHPACKAESSAMQIAYRKYEKAVDGGLRLNIQGSWYTATPYDVYCTLKIKNNKVSFDKHGVKLLAKKYAAKPYGKSAKVKTASGWRTLTDYRNCVPDYDKSYAEITTALRDKMAGNKDAEATIHVHRNTKIDANYTRVDVSLSSQTARYYHNGSLKLTTPVVTGKNGHNTPPGIYSVTYKARNVDLKGNNDDGSKYSSHVSYWMPFNGGIGLHDAPWRSAFGGAIHFANGSHGCVNMPPSAAARLYSMVRAGTPVVVY
jgi:lipoprotein-anchoring transpeptidase ErfK/SrfK